MNEEFASLGQAIATAVFLVFVVMAAQFESPKFSIMVMTTIPFALIGSFLFLWLVDCPISMTSLLGFLMLVGNGSKQWYFVRRYGEPVPGNDGL